MKSTDQSSGSGRRVRVLLVGAGGVSKHHYYGWLHSGRAEVCGIMDVSIEVARQRKGQWACDAPVFDSLEEAITATAPDVVDVCTPEYTHCEVGLEALSRGLPVLTEKIMAHSLPAGYAMFKAAGKPGTWAGVTYNYPYFPAFRKLKEIIESKEAGLIGNVSITCHSYCYHHLLSVMYGLFGTPVTVDAYPTERDWPEHFEQRFRIDPDLLYVPTGTFGCKLTFPDERVCTVNASLLPDLNALPFQVLAIFESSKVIEINALSWGENMVGNMFYLPDAQNRIALDAPSEKVDCQVSFDGMLSDAAARLLSRRGPAFTWQDGWNIMLMEHAIVVSGKENTSVQFADLKDRVEKRMEE